MRSIPASPHFGRATALIFAILSFSSPNQTHREINPNTQQGSSEMENPPSNEARFKSVDIFDTKRRRRRAQKILEILNKKGRILHKYERDDPIKTPEDFDGLNMPHPNIQRNMTQSEIHSVTEEEYR